MDQELQALTGVFQVPVTYVVMPGGFATLLLIERPCEYTCTMVHVRPNYAGKALDFSLIKIDLVVFDENSEFPNAVNIQPFCVVSDSEYDGIGSSIEVKTYEEYVKLQNVPKKFRCKYLLPGIEVDYNRYCREYSCGGLARFSNSNTNSITLKKNNGAYVFCEETLTTYNENIDNIRYITISGINDSEEIGEICELLRRCLGGYLNITLMGNE